MNVVAQSLKGSEHRPLAMVHQSLNEPGYLCQSFLDHNMCKSVSQKHNLCNCRKAVASMSEVRTLKSCHLRCYCRPYQSKRCSCCLPAEATCHHKKKRARHRSHWQLRRRKRKRSVRCWRRRYHGFVMLATEEVCLSKRGRVPW